MPNHNLQEPLQPFPPMLNHIVAEPVREHLPGQRRDCHARGLALENVAEVLEIRVSPADGALFEFEGGNIGAADDLVVGVHVAVGAMCLWVFNLIDVVIRYN